MSKIEFLDPLEAEKFRKQKCIQFLLDNLYDMIQALFCKRQRGAGMISKLSTFKNFPILGLRGEIK